jgi:hypothetical protein
MGQAKRRGSFEERAMRARAERMGYILNEKGEHIACRWKRPYRSRPPFRPIHSTIVLACMLGVALR